VEAITSPTAPTAASAPGQAAAEQCEQCAAAVASDQRYCVECGAHRRYVQDPAARYMRARASAGRVVTRTGAARSHRPPSLALALLLAVVPVAVGLGVLVGRSASGGDGKLITALRAQRAQVVTVGGSGATAATASATPLSSTFPLQNGWSVELQTLPAHGTTQSAVSSAEDSARANGASNVGLIVPSGFRVTPSSGGAYVVYSGAYHSRAAAQTALAKLSSHFKDAKVIHIVAVGASASATGGGQALTHTGFGTAHQIAGSKPTTSQLAAGSQVVKHIQQTQGKSYVNAQRGLPDQISIR
jgi:hypothetical protein